MLSHGSEDFAYKPQHARGKWYAADFANEETHRAASRLAEDLSWPCHGVSLADEEASVSGPGQLSIQNGHLRAHGKATIHVRKAPDFEYFRPCIAIERGNLPAELFDVAQRLHDRKLVPQLPDQVIVNEYQPGQGISPHIDAPSSFADGIAMISLLDSWEMAFHAPGSKRKGPKVVLEKGSAAIVKSDARYKWKHEIAKRKTDPYIDEAGKRRMRKRQRRISLTFRKVLQS